MFPRFRRLSSAGAAVLVLAAVATISPAAALAAPVVAEATDLAVVLTGTSMAASVPSKGGEVRISNHGPHDVAGVRLTVDLSALDADKVRFVGFDDCSPEAGQVTLVCELDDKLAGGANLHWLFSLDRRDGATGDAGSLTVSVETDVADLKPADNTATAPVTLGGTELDVTANAWDVWDYALDGGADKPIPAGGTGNLIMFVSNAGDRAVKGLSIVVTLPKHVSFTDKVKECRYCPDNRVATCDYATTVLVTEKDEDPEGDNGGAFASLWLDWQATVATDAPAPASLVGGRVTVEAKGEVTGTALARHVGAASSARPSNALAAPPKLGADVDPSDNTNVFTVFVGKADGADNGNGDGDGDGGNGGLPVTGAATGVIGAVGGGVLVLGAGLVLLTRRRRIITVTSAEVRSSD